MRFQVPQFIEVEDKIFGPLTLKQFIYMAGGGGISFVIYALVNNLLIAIVPIIAIMALSGALAFAKVNNRPLIAIAESAFTYYFGTKLYIWKKAENVKPKTTAAAITEARGYASVMVPKISDSKLKDLSWSLDVKEKLSPRMPQKSN